MIFKWFIRLAIFALLGAGYYYAKPIKEELDGITVKMFPPKPTLTPEQMAKVKSVNDAAAKRDSALNDVMR